MNVTLKCQCGSMRGVINQVSRSTGSRFICLCDDCQAYAHFLGRAKEVLDSNGGTDIFPVAPSKIKITQGAENLRCLRLNEKGMLRWYAGCCKTPIANTQSSYKVPFAGTVHTIMSHADDHKTREEALGPVKARVLGKYGIGPLPKGTHQTASFSTILEVVSFLFLGWIRRQHQPSPFFDPAGKPQAEPYILTSAERENLRQFCGPK